MNKLSGMKISEHLHSKLRNKAVPISATKTHSDATGTHNDTVSQNTANHKLLLFMTQLTTMYNATALGWKIKKIKGNKFIITKKINNMTKLDNNTRKLLVAIMESN
jgi:hypothetical protein